MSIQRNPFDMQNWICFRWQLRCYSSDISYHSESQRRNRETNNLFRWMSWKCLQQTNGIVVHVIIMIIYQIEGNPFSESQMQFITLLLNQANSKQGYLGNINNTPFVLFIFILILIILCKQYAMHFLLTISSGIRIVLVEKD